jgi:hypothetical protein
MPLISTIGVASSRSFGFGSVGLTPLNWTKGTNYFVIGSGTSGCSIYWLNNRFIVHGGYNGGSTTAIAYSTDGVNWNTVSTGVSYTTGQPSYGNGYYVVPTGQSSTGSILYSTNGTSFSLDSFGGSAWTCSAFNTGESNFYIIASGGNTSTRTGEVYRFSNPTSLSYRGRLPLYNYNPSYYSSACSNVSGTVVVVGNMFTSPFVGAYIWSSTDGGANWNTPVTVPGANIYFRDVRWTGTQFVAIGTDFGTTSGLLFTSPDGVTWTQQGTKKGSQTEYNSTRYVVDSESTKNLAGGYIANLGVNPASYAYSPTLNLWVGVSTSFISSQYRTFVHTAPGP